MTDPIAAMLIMMKNAGNAEKASITVPFSKLKEAIALCLKDNGYAASVSKKTKKGHPVLEVGLMYKDGAPKVKDVERVSKPSRRMYMGHKDIRPFKNGYGVAVFSTPKGILADKDARKEQVGGEILFRIS